MKAGEIAQATGVLVHTIRYYQRIGLLAPSKNSLNGYHVYSAADVLVINFIRRAQGVGMTLDEIRVVFDRAKQPTTPCPEVRDLFRLGLSEVERHVVEWTALRDRMRLALCAWRGMPDGAPNGDEVCALIESLGAQRLA